MPKIMIGSTITNAITPRANRTLASRLLAASTKPVIVVTTKPTTIAVIPIVRLDIITCISPQNEQEVFVFD
jgi:hypothetical protein